ncbi:MAG: response regulator [Clostridia bacterium]|nr:response regulator [Clostridia bacterium]
MKLGKKIRVLVVDDSRLFREVLSIGISSDPNIEVVAKAAHAFEARDKILKFRPDLITCDIEMPKMNGIEFIMDLITKIKTVAYARVSIKDNISIPNKASANVIDTNKIIAIGASTGGTEAIGNLISSLPNTCPGIAIVQHIPPVFSKMFAQRLNESTNFTVKEAENGDYLEQGKIFIAPGHSHMKIKKVANRYKIQCFQGDKVNGHCPSVDVLFESVAKECGSDAVGIILTGMGYDGAKGLLAMRRQGARTIGQDENSSVVYGMPKVAFNIGAVEKQVSLAKIPDLLLSMLR